MRIGNGLLETNQAENQFWRKCENKVRFEQYYEFKIVEFTQTEKQKLWN